MIHFIPICVNPKVTCSDRMLKKKLLMTVKNKLIIYYNDVGRRGRTVDFKQIYEVMVIIVIIIF